MSGDHFRSTIQDAKGKKKETRISHVINAKKDVRGAKASLTFTWSTWARPFSFFYSLVGPAKYFSNEFQNVPHVIARMWLPLISDNRAVLMLGSCGHISTEITMT